MFLKYFIMQNTETIYAVIPYVIDVEYGKIKLNKVPLKTAAKAKTNAIKKEVVLDRNSFEIKNIERINFINNIKNLKISLD